MSVLVEYTVRLKLSEGYVLLIESPFTFSSHDQTTTLSPDEDPEESFLPLRRLAGLTIDEASVASTGTLLVRFCDGTRIEVPPDEAYEAWNVSGPDGALVVCTPGGELAIWTAGSR